MMDHGALVTAITKSFWIRMGSRIEITVQVDWDDNSSFLHST
jgi:hypothetical protein